MNMARKGIAALLWLTVSTAALAAFPDKPVKIVIGFPAGGPLDQHARLLTDRLQAVLGQPVIVDYKPGAGGSVGAEDQLPILDSTPQQGPIEGSLVLFRLPDSTSDNRPLTLRIPGRDGPAKVKLDL